MNKTKPKKKLANTKPQSNKHYSNLQLFTTEQTEKGYRREMPQEAGKPLLISVHSHCFLFLLYPFPVHPHLYIHVYIYKVQLQRECNMHHMHVSSATAINRPISILLNPLEQSFGFLQIHLLPSWQSFILHSCHLQCFL